MTESSKPPRISVLVCTRNRGAYIGKCIRSILESKLREMELLVIDQSDGKETSDVVLAIDDPRLRYLRTPTRGLSRARNIGIEASSGPIVLFTDDDNYADPTWVEKILEQFDADPKREAVYGRVMAYGKGGEGQTCPTIMESMEPRQVDGLGGERIQGAVGHGNNMAFRRECFVKHGLYLEWLGAGTPMTGGEDTDFSFRLLRAGARIYYSPEPVVHHDNWMPIEKANKQLHGYVCSGAVVYTRYVLRGSKTALAVQRFCFADYRKSMRWWKDQKSPEGIEHVRTMVRRHWKGILLGILYVFRRPKRYRPGQKTLEWQELRSSPGLSVGGPR
jgi:glycosyltransferase involved in cell wall biosynthesis